jgi:drug/metabolite transporter (DMT)-like permease
VRSLGRYASSAGLILAAACWGLTTVTVKVAGEGMPSALITVTELSVAVVLLWIVVWIRRTRTPGLPAPRPSRGLLVLGLLEPAIAFALMNLGITMSSASTASLIVGLQSGFVILIAAIFFGLRPSKIAWIALVIGLVGVILVTGWKAEPTSVLGNIFVFLGMLSAAVAIALTSRIVQNTDASTLTAWQFTFGWLFVVPTSAVLWKLGLIQVHSPIGTKYWAAAVATGVLGSFMGFLLYNWALGRIQVGIAAMAINLIPVFGVFFAVTLLGESFQGAAIIGAVLVFIGLILFSLDARDEIAATGGPHPEADQTRNTTPTGK